MLKVPRHNGRWRRYAEYGRQDKLHRASETIIVYRSLCKILPGFPPWGSLKAHAHDAEGDCGLLFSFFFTISLFPQHLSQDPRAIRATSSLSLTGS